MLVNNVQITAKNTNWWNDPTVIGASIGVGGVIIGGLLTGLSSYILFWINDQKKSKEIKCTRLEEIHKLVDGLDNLILSNKLFLGVKGFNELEIIKPHMMSTLPTQNNREEENKFFDDYRSRKAEVNSAFDEVSKIKSQLKMLVSMYFSELDENVNMYLKGVNKFIEYQNDRTVTVNSNWSDEELNKLKMAREEFKRDIYKIIKKYS